MASKSIAEFVHADPELELPCAAWLDETRDETRPPLDETEGGEESALPPSLSAAKKLRRLVETTLDETRPPSLSAAKKLRRLLERAYKGFDDADWAKVQAWVKADPER